MHRSSSAARPQAMSRLLPLILADVDQQPPRTLADAGHRRRAGRGRGRPVSGRRRRASGQVPGPVGRGQGQDHHHRHVARPPTAPTIPAYRHNVIDHHTATTTSSAYRDNAPAAGGADPPRPTAITAPAGGRTGGSLARPRVRATTALLARLEDPARRSISARPKQT